MKRDITFILKTAFYDKVCKSLKDPKNERALFSYISNYRNKNIEVLSSPYISNIVVFNSVGEDANIVLSQTARTFLPENIGANEITREKNNIEIKKFKKQIKNIGDTVINEALNIIEKQEKFFS